MTELELDPCATEYPAFNSFSGFVGSHLLLLQRSISSPSIIGFSPTFALFPKMALTELELDPFATEYPAFNGFSGFVGSHLFLLQRSLSSPSVIGFSPTFALFPQNGFDRT
ncbi:hypothetical protein [Pontibacter sp. G13]|uniref:hypothetical protein n=1 Tax=Pontibacter sp. G13 TaxID=3074898 RepID=UPI00288AC576|nr:hypothetical protein [Pontibacter sp. G13]WNJ17771.1 hypothetical protein RJD25_23205 [Pontibacter sp. G13]